MIQPATTKTPEPKKLRCPLCPLGEAWKVIRYHDYFQCIRGHHTPCEPTVQVEKPKR